jgi:hypothetical protein
MKISNLVYTHNHYVPNQIGKIAQWHHDRNLIDESTNNTQFKKLLEEVAELYATLNPHKNPGDIATDLIANIGKMLKNGRIKQAVIGTDIKDDIGDINVVLINMAEREGFTMQQCLETAWNDIKYRKGKMIDGVFVKESDL